MDTYDSIVKPARAVRVGDTLIGVDRDGEHLFRVNEVRHEDGQVTLVTSEHTVTLAPRDAVRIAHPDIPILNRARSTFPTTAT